MKHNDEASKRLTQAFGVQCDARVGETWIGERDEDNKPTENGEWQMCIAVRVADSRAEYGIAQPFDRWDLESALWAVATAILDDRINAAENANRNKDIAPTVSSSNR